MRDYPWAGQNPLYGLENRDGHAYGYFYALEIHA